MEEFVNVYLDREDSTKAQAPTSKRDKFYGRWVDHGTSFINFLSSLAESGSLGQTQRPWSSWVLL